MSNNIVTISGESSGAGSSLLLSVCSSGHRIKSMRQCLSVLAANVLTQAQVVTQYILQGITITLKLLMVTGDTFMCLGPHSQYHNMLQCFVWCEEKQLCFIYCCWSIVSQFSDVKVTSDLFYDSRVFSSWCEMWWKEIQWIQWQCHSTWQQILSVWSSVSCQCCQLGQIWQQLLFEWSVSCQCCQLRQIWQQLLW